MHIPVHTHACWHMCVCRGVHICGHVRVCAGVCWHVHGCVRACAHACAGLCLHRPPVFTLLPSAVPEDADPRPAGRASSPRRRGRPWAARLGQGSSRSVTRTPRAWPRWRSRRSLRTRGPRLDGRRLCRTGRADPSVWSAEAAPRGQGYGGGVAFSAVKALVSGQHSPGLLTGAGTCGLVALVTARGRDTDSQRGSWVWLKVPRCLGLRGRPALSPGRPHLPPRLG